MLLKFVLILIAFVCLPTNGNIVDDGIAQLKEIAVKLTSDKSNLHQYVKNIREFSKNRYNKKYEVLKRNIEEHTLQAKIQAEALNCHPSILQRIDFISKDVIEDWRDCMKITDPVTDIIELGIDFTKELEASEATLCVGIRNMTLCNETGFLDRYTCVSNALGQFMAVISKEDKGLVYWFEQLNQDLKDLGVQIGKCMDVTSSNFIQDVKELLGDGNLCPSKLSQDINTDL